MQRPGRGDGTGRGAGRRLQLVHPPRAQWLEILTGAGLSRRGAEEMAELTDCINDGSIGFSGEGERRTSSEGPADFFKRVAPSRAAA